MTGARYGLIEAGGTKFVLGVADAERTIHARERIPTTTPEETLGAAVEWFAAQGIDYAAFGIASFGPLDLDPASPKFGCVRPTPKPHWSGASLIAPFQKRFGVPVAIDTDVNGAALSEALWGAGAGLGSLLYLTIGTGIGGGFCSDGQLLRGLSHPEMGHIRMPRHPEGNGRPAGPDPRRGAGGERRLHRGQNQRADRASGAWRKRRTAGGPRSRAQVDSLTSKRGWRMTEWISSPAMRWITLVTRFSAPCSRSCAMVVSGGMVCSPSGRPS